MVTHAQGRTKLAAMTEVGQEAIPMSTWFTQAVLAPIKYDTVNTNIAYAAVWRNASTTHHFAPYPGHSSVPDFLVFYNDPYTLFESDLPPMYVLPQPDLEPPLIVSDHDSVYVSPTVDVAITVETNERAYLRYGPADAAFGDLPYAFTGGEGGMVHTLTIASSQGESGTLYVRARDLFGNAMTQSEVIRYEVDTLELPVYWTDLLYPVADWPAGVAPIGSDPAAATHPQPVRTLYFRTSFTLASLPTAMAIFVKSYGGIAASVNGHEVGRINFTTADRLEYTTDPTTTAGVNKQFLFDSLALRALRVGENVVAVEVHVAPTGSVPSFDAYVMDQTMTRVVPFGATWSYFDKGYRPVDKTLREVLNAVSDDALVPEAMALSANYPNPFNPATSVTYALSHGSEVTLEVYDVLGRRVAVLVDEYRPAGTYTARFDAGRLASGTYILRMHADGFQAARKMLLLR